MSQNVILHSAVEGWKPGVMGELVEREVTVKVCCSPAEKMTRDYPGCEAEGEVYEVTFDDNGAPIPEDIYEANREEWALEALERVADRKRRLREAAEAAAEDEAEARWKGEI